MRERGGAEAEGGSAFGMGGRAWPWVMCALITALVAYLAWPVVAGLGEVIYRPGGDGWKNVYVVVYHVLHDEAYLHTEAMHWPWGEHVAMADGQVGLSAALKLVHAVVPLSGTAITYVVLVLPLLSVVGCALLVYRLLRDLTLARLSAAAWALPIALLQPQFARLTGHYALAYAAMIPLVMWLWLRHRRGGYGVGGAALTGLAVLGFGSLHFYNLAVLGGMLLCLYGLDAALYRRPHRLRIALAAALAVAAPLAVTLGVSAASDVHDDRIAQPYGHTAYNGSVEGMVAHRELPWWRFVDEHVIAVDYPTEEGEVYLGIVVILVLAVAGGRWVERAAGRRRLRSGSGGVRREELALLALTGIFAAVFSYGFPLGISAAPFEQIRAASGPLQQFRSLGRFGWVSYYCFAIAAVCLLRAWCGRAQVSGVPTVVSPAGQLKPLFWIALAVAIAEAGYLRLRRPLPFTEHYLAADRDALAAALGGHAYAAVLPIPFPHIGSENFSKPDFGPSLYVTTYPSLASGVPNAGLYLSRTSYGDAVQSVAFAQAFVNVPPYLAAGDPSQRYALCVSKLIWGEKEWLRDDYTELLAAASLEYENERLRLYSIPRARLAEAALATRAATLRRLFDADGGSDPIPTVLPPGVQRATYDELDNSRGILGSGGAVVRAGRGPEEVARFALNGEGGTATEGGVEVRVDAHLYLALEGHPRARVILEAFDARGGLLHRGKYQRAFHFRSLAEGWGLVSVSDVVPAGTTELAVSVLPDEDAAAGELIVDEVVLAEGADRAYAYPLPGGGTVAGPAIVDGQLWTALTQVTKQ